MAESKKYILVINPIAGDVDKTDIAAAVKAYAEAGEVEVVQFDTTGGDDETAILNLYHDVKPERVLVAGGDGTIKMVAEALETVDVVIGILPAGSANGLAVDLGFPTLPEEILKVAFHGDVMNVDMICINGRRSLHLSDIGLNAELIRNYENGTIRGKIGYAIQAVNTLTDSESPFRATVTANGNTVEADAKMIVIANSKKYGTGVTINPHGVMDDGKFEIVIIKNLDFMIFGKIVTGNMPLDSGDIELISASEATITTDVPVHFQVDGEYCGEVTNLDITMLTQRLKIAVP
jgi:YegS/Rv2252/BmrU family lipid kinase